MLSPGFAAVATLPTEQQGNLPQRQQWCVATYPGAARYSFAPATFATHRNMLHSTAGVMAAKEKVDAWGRRGDGAGTEGEGGPGGC